MSKEKVLVELFAKSLRASMSKAVEREDDLVVQTLAGIAVFSMWLLRDDALYEAAKKSIKEREHEMEDIAEKNEVMLDVLRAVGLASVRADDTDTEGNA